jgi:hypothetical protein
MPVRRRQFLGQGLMLMLAAVGRRAWAQALSRRFRPLAGPVVVPLADLATPWHAKSFMADAVTLASAATPNKPIRLSGMVVRTADSDNQPASFTAICVRCPHEGCDVDFVADPKSLPQDVKDEIGHAVTGVSAAAVEIGEVEEDLLIFV